MNRFLIICALLLSVNSYAVITENNSVNKITAGTNITVTPAGGRGNVTVTTASTMTITRMNSGVQGIEGNVWTKFGSSDSWAAAAGGGGAYTAREYKWEAGEFSYPSWGNALLYKNEFGNATSSKTIYTADFDTNTDEFASFSIANFDSKYDGGNITWEITFFSSAAVTGTVEFNINVTTATALNSTLVNTQTFGNFDAGDGTAYEVTFATFTQSANLPTANKAYHCVLWVDASDSSIGSDTKVLGIKMKYGVSAD